MNNGSRCFRVSPVHHSEDIHGHNPLLTLTPTTTQSARLSFYSSSTIKHDDVWVPAILHDLWTLPATIACRDCNCCSRDLGRSTQTHTGQRHTKQHAADGPSLVEGSASSLLTNLQVLYQLQLSLKGHVCCLNACDSALA